MTDSVNEYIFQVVQLFKKKREIYKIPNAVSNITFERKNLLKQSNALNLTLDKT